MNASQIKVGQFVMVARPVQSVYGIIQAGTIGKVDSKRLGMIRVLVPTSPDQMIYHGVEIHPKDLMATREKI